MMRCEDCKLLQLHHSYSAEEMYGEGYGYRSGLNQSMVDHLRDLARGIQVMRNITSEDLIVDIGGNDGTLLGFFPRDCHRLNIDPTAEKFADFMPQGVTFVAELFRPILLHKRKAKVITAIAMFYDIEDPLQFLIDVRNSLTEDGVFVCEVNDASRHLFEGIYDHVCHEHTIYYSDYHLRQLFDAAGFKIEGKVNSDANGGSLCIFATPGKGEVGSATLYSIDESSIKTKIEMHAEHLRNTVQSMGGTVFGYGASTKGNIILQTARLTKEDIPYIVDVNPDKWGKVTPGTEIPIISPEEAWRMKANIFLVLPWHFRENILAREKGTFIFPFPTVEIVHQQ